MQSREQSRELLTSYVSSDSLRHHCEMVAVAMEGYATRLNKPAEVTDRWWAAGLLHDIDWEDFPDEHPHRAVDKILPDHGYDEEVIAAVEAHAPERTNRQPEAEIERYLYACDELSGFMVAVSLMRPNGFSDMKVKSVTKKLKDKKFAANVPRESIKKGAELISLPLNEHIRNMINIFKDRGV